MKAHWTECEICAVKVDRTPRALEMTPSATAIPPSSRTEEVPTQEVRSGLMPMALVGILVIPERDEVHKLRAGDNAVGASDTNDILIEGKYVSASHAVISWRPGEGFMVTDLNSTNGTFVNDQRVSKQRVADGDTIRFGNMAAILKSIR